jgi:hypothetical protein
VTVRLTYYVVSIKGDVADSKISAVKPASIQADHVRAWKSPSSAAMAVTVEYLICIEASNRTSGRG